MGPLPVNLESYMEGVDRRSNLLDKRTSGRLQRVQDFLRKLNLCIDLHISLISKETGGLGLLLAIKMIRKSEYVYPPHFMSVPARSFLGGWVLVFVSWEVAFLAS